MNYINTPLYENESILRTSDLDRLRQQAALAERYYVMTQMSDTWQDWTCGTRNLWVSAFEATLPPEPAPETVTVTLPLVPCTSSTRNHKPHIWSGGACFCNGKPL